MSSSAERITAQEGPIADLLYEDLQAHILNRGGIVRCMNCKEFMSARKIHSVGCSSCKHDATYCRECGGDERARKNIMYHTRIYASERFIDWYGKGHVRAWLSFQRGKRRAAKDGKQGLRILDGGKR